jgi:hypothetical protein
MNTEINISKIIAHISGFTDNSKKDFFELLKKSNLYNYVNIVDVDLITNNIVSDKNMEILYSKFEYYLNSSKNNKFFLQKSKELEKKMFLYWKVKMEYYINKIINNSQKKILLIGYLSYFKNHKINLNLSINSKFFIKVNYLEHAKTIIEYNLDNSRNDIINGIFDLNFLDINFLIKKRTLLQHIYNKLNYINMNLISIVNIIELNLQIKIPNILYYSTFNKYEKKIPVLSEPLYLYNNEWLALTNILNTSHLNNINVDNDNDIVKGIKNNKPYIVITQNQLTRLSKAGYIYEIIDTTNFLPYPSKNNVYKYLTMKPIKINRTIYIKNIINQIKNLNISVITK